ncbi:hypothetical protein [Nocardioides sp.]|jgi:hypothetical protein|uniref:hypothetical protein n=1 Tax=Nocardioides sp. TaxID=35761 RepID=UPI00261F4D0D|nr:hypothetical protein [Nocardioides sp.]
MFTHTCSACSRRQLIFSTQITSVTSVDAGIAYHFTCWCGEQQSAVQVTDRSQTVRIA